VFVPERLKPARVVLSYGALIAYIRVQVNQRLPFPLSATYFPLLSAFHSMSTFRPNNNISMGVTLACYQQAGSSRKYINVSRKWSR
jgi:hypothetical protein